MQVPLRLPESTLLQSSTDTGTMLAHPGLMLRAEHSEDLAPLAGLLVAVDADWGDVPFRIAVREGGLPAARDVIMRPKFDSVVAELNGKVIGYGALRREPEAVMLVNMLVSPDHQGKGIGRMIVTELCSRVSALGEHVHLDVLLDSRGRAPLVPKSRLRCIRSIHLED